MTFQIHEILNHIPHKLFDQYFFPILLNLMQICKVETKFKSKHNDVIREESISCLISVFEKIRGLS